LAILAISTEQTSFLNVPTTQADAKGHHRICNRILLWGESKICFAAFELVK
jgi:hypothetical protein